MSGTLSFGRPTDKKLEETPMAAETAALLTDAARTTLLADGYAGLSTRRVAQEAGVPLSQIHYHFGGKQGLVLALLERENARLVARQEEMYAAEVPLSVRYDQACDFLDDDLASGYVRVLQEMIAAGWSDEAVARKVSELLHRWFGLLTRVLEDVEGSLPALAPFSAQDLATLVGLAFLGAESLLLLDDARWSQQVRPALRRVGDLIRLAEQDAPRS
jgi:AcrR family transcriptional regulator